VCSKEARNGRVSAVRLKIVA